MKVCDTFLLDLFVSSFKNNKLSLFEKNHLPSSAHLDQSFPDEEKTGNWSFRGNVPRLKNKLSRTGRSCCYVAAGGWATWSLENWEFFGGFLADVFGSEGERKLLASEFDSENSWRKFGLDNPENRLKHATSPGFCCSSWASGRSTHKL